MICYFSDNTVGEQVLAEIVTASFGPVSELRGALIR